MFQGLYKCLQALALQMKEWQAPIIPWVFIVEEVSAFSESTESMEQKSSSKDQNSPRKERMVKCLAVYVDSPSDSTSESVRKILLSASLASNNGYNVDLNHNQSFQGHCYWLNELEHYEVLVRIGIIQLQDTWLIFFKLAVDFTLLYCLHFITTFRRALLGIMVVLKHSSKKSKSWRAILVYLLRSFSKGPRSRK